MKKLLLLFVFLMQFNTLITKQGFDSNDKHILVVDSTNCICSQKIFRINQYIDLYLSKFDKSQKSNLVFHDFSISGIIKFLNKRLSTNLFNKFCEIKASSFSIDDTLKADDHFHICIIEIHFKNMKDKDKLLKLFKKQKFHHFRIKLLTKYWIDNIEEGIVLFISETARHPIIIDEYNLHYDEK